MSFMLPKAVQDNFLRIIQPLINYFIRSRINPNWFTTMGLLLNMGAALSFALGAIYGTRVDLEYVGWGGVLVILGGICDIMDGKVARAAGLSTRFGALYDSVLDRYSEVIMFIGMGYYLIAQGYFYTSIFCFIALGGSTMVSYIRARSEGLRLECRVGLMQRAERIVWLGVGSLFCGLSEFFVHPTYALVYGEIELFKPIYLFTVPVFVVAILSNFTSIQRMLHSYRQSVEVERTEEREPSLIHEPMA
jgi:CDP-diacylglycerol--glycerol-3-phosphate 3-phosphatidyltransferase